MHSRSLGGLEVGAVGLGCMGMTFAYTTGVRDDEASVQAIRRALDIGVTLIDTADVYGPYTGEQLVGRALHGRRHEATVATKVGLVIPDPAAPSTMYRDGSPEHVRSAVEASLCRLGVDYVDLYQLHRVDPAVPLEETWGAMAELVEKGLVLRLGLSEVGVEELARAHRVHPVATVQSELSLWTRDALDGVVPWCAEHGVGVIAYAPLGRGLLAGRYRSVADLAPDDRRTRLPRFAADAFDANLALVSRITVVADRYGATPGQLALAWVLAQGEHIVPIPGTKQARFVEENAAAADLVVDPGDLELLSTMPEPVGARY
jgi:aryl-alcohol dehydrogenase-like predicted oxidoreductase